MVRRGRACPRRPWAGLPRRLDRCRDRTRVPGALSRVVGLFSQRGYNIETLNVAPTDDPTLSRLTLTTFGDDKQIEQITKHLNKLIDVVKLVDLTEGAHIGRDLMLSKVRAQGTLREEVKRTTDIFRGQIVDVGPNVYTIQLAGTSDKLDSFVAAMAGEADGAVTNPFKGRSRFGAFFGWGDAKIAWTGGRESRVLVTRQVQLVPWGF